MFRKLALVALAYTVLFILQAIAQPGQNPAVLNDYYRKAELLYNLDAPDPADDSLALYYYETIASAPGLLPARAALVADCHIKAGAYHQYYQRFGQAIGHYRQALAINKGYLQDTVIAYTASLHLGTALFASNIVDSARIYLELSDSYARKRANLPEQETLYNSLGVIYYESGNFIQARNYFERAISVIDRRSPEDYQEAYISFSANIANCLTQLHRYPEALALYRKLLPGGAISGKITQNMGHAFFEMKQYDSALYYFRRVPAEQSVSAVKMLNEIGRIYIDQSNWVAAEQTFDSALAINRVVAGMVKNRYRASSYLYLSQLAEKQGLYDEAIIRTNDALQELHFNFNWKKSDDLPPDVINAVSAIGFFEALNQKARVHMLKYRQGGDRKMLNASLKAYMLAVDAADYIKKSFDNDEAKLLFEDDYNAIYREAADAVWRAYANEPGRAYADQFLRIIEQYKGSILYQELEHDRIKDISDMPPDLLNREKELKQMLAFYTTRLNANTDPKNEEQLRRQFNNLQVELSRLQQSFEQNAAYGQYKYRFSPQVFTVEKLQRELDNNTAIASFMYSDTAIFCLALSKDEHALVNIPVDSALKSLIRDFVEQTYRRTEGRRYEGYEPGAKLYQLLLGPVTRVMGPEKRWVIMPDGVLNYIPFDALLTGNKSRNFIALEKNISYHYSVSLLLQPSVRPIKEGRALAFAPFSQSGRSNGAVDLPVLPYSVKELKQTGAETYMHSQATKQAFMQQSAGAGLIHLATHARSGTDSMGEACIYFYPEEKDSTSGRIFLHEIYAMQLPACRLVVLSACETADGQLAGGEGLLSFARAFLYAGADGVVSTLWRTEDQISSYLMERFHYHRSKGRGNDEALARAKRDFLGDPSFDPRFKAPNYWANFVYTGQLDPQNTSFYQTPPAFILYGLAVLAALLFFLKRKKRF